MRALLLLPLIAFMHACVSVRSTISSDLQLSLPSKADPNQICYFSKKPEKTAWKIGTISVDGNGCADFEDLLVEAKERAAKLGGDFILKEDSGVEMSTRYTPASSSFESVTYRNQHGQKEEKANQVSVGAKIETISRPWGVFSIWVYARSQLGLRLDAQNIVQGFHLNTDAQAAGVKIGDRLIGIDGCDMQDQNAVERQMSIRPGERVKLTFQRDAQWVECFVTALPN